jgi:hypothetical protein
LASPQQALNFARTNLIAYAIANWDGYKAGRHSRLIAEKLEAVERGEIKRLMIFMPPRHGKSMLVSEFFPPWYMGRHPDRYIIAASYSEGLAEDFGFKVRNQLRDPIHNAIFPECHISDESQSKVKITTKERGIYFAVGAGGPITGRGAHLLLIDDPIKNREVADSEIERRKLKDWYTSTAYTRLMPDGAIIIIQTRWHEDDLAGWLLREHAHEDWDVLSLPALTNEDEPQALWPEAYSVERLQTIQKSLGARDWSALYMQTPSAGGGGEFKRDWIRHYHRQTTDGQNVYLLVDPANEKKKRADYTSYWVIGTHRDGNYYVHHLRRDRHNLAERTRTVFDLHRRFRPMRVGYESIGLKADVQHILSEQEHQKYRFAITELSSGNQMSKNDRIRRLIPIFEAQRIYLPESLHLTDTNGRVVDMVEEFIEREYASFPAALHDDMIDGLSWITWPDMMITFPAEQGSDIIEYDDTGIV